MQGKIVQISKIQRYEAGKQWEVGDFIDFHHAIYKVVGVTKRAFWLLNITEYNDDEWFNELWDLSGAVPALISRPWDD